MMSGTLSTAVRMYCTNQAGILNTDSNPIIDRETENTSVSSGT